MGTRDSTLAVHRRRAIKVNTNSASGAAAVNGRGAAGADWEIFADYMARAGVSPVDAVSGSEIALPDGMTAYDYGRELCARPEVLSRIQGIQHRVIRGELVHKAIRCIGHILDDDDAPAAARVSAARLTLDAAGLLSTERAPAGNVPDERAQARLTPAELTKQLRDTREQIQALRSVLALPAGAAGAEQSPGFHPTVDLDTSEIVDL